MGCLQGGELAVRRTVGWFIFKAACTAVNQSRCGCRNNVPY